MNDTAAMDAFFSYFTGDSPVLQSIGKWAYYIYASRESWQMYIHLVLSAIFPIYIGSHASLRRPPSAATPEKKETDEDDDELEVEQTMEGLTPSDAIMFPVMAGITLGGLYLVIKWLENPKILNKILNWYFSALGIFGIGRLAADFLNVVTTFIFPSVWSSGKETYFIEPLLSQQVTGPVSKSRVQVHRKFVEDKTNPFPGFLSTIKFSDNVTKTLWAVRAAFYKHWIFRGHLQGVFSAKSHVKLNDVIGLVAGVVAIATYNLTGQPWLLTNLIGFGFCYGTLPILSPTTFWTGTLVLTGLFIYDITMVFYTPLMVTVATSLDVPIKLVFPGPKNGSMLGLGDVVLPGIMMALALRFDLYLHYLRQQRIVTKPALLSEFAKDVVVRETYVEATGQWGERFWTRSIKRSSETTAADGARFSKIYFKASIVGYIVAMIVTLVVMNIYRHAQPALLYLVPGVLIALWGTALVRKEVPLMWEYTEDGEWGFEKKETDSKEKPEMKIFTGGKSSDESASSGTVETSGTQSIGSETEITSVSDASTIVAPGNKKKDEKDEHAHHVFLFSLSEPKDRSKKLKLT